MNATEFSMNATEFSTNVTELSTSANTTPEPANLSHTDWWRTMNRLNESDLANSTSNNTDWSGPGFPPGFGPGGLGFDVTCDGCDDSNYTFTCPLQNTLRVVNGSSWQMDPAEAVAILTEGFVKCASPRMDPADPKVDLCFEPARKFTPRMAQCLLQNKFVRQMKNFAKLGMKIFSPLAHNREVVCIYPKHEIDEPADDAEDEDE
jgi:hypothetical protein